MRRVMEALSTGLLINGPGLMDPCEKEPHDALSGLSKQQREDLTVTAQQMLRQIAFRQIFKVINAKNATKTSIWKIESNIFDFSLYLQVLGMDSLPPQKFQQRQWRFSRKRRRSGTEGNDAEGDSKLVKKEDGETNEQTSANDSTNANGTNSLANGM